MQHYLLDSNQRLNVSFSKDSVAAYYQCFNQPYRKEVPPLMCASLWPKFDLFKKYANSELILTKSAINQTQKIEVEMKFNEIWINEYLALVNDDNPIHNEIVPGQLVSQMMLMAMSLETNQCQINYVKPILINENIEFIEQHEHEIIAINDDGEIKIKISLSTKK